MSKRRLVVTAVLAGQSQSEVARTCGGSQGWISRLMARYRVEGEAAFDPLSRAPKTSPAATSAGTVELVLRLRKQLSDAGLDAGADTIGWLWPTITALTCRGRRSTGSWSAPVLSHRSRRSGRRAPTSGSKLSSRTR